MGRVVVSDERWCKSFSSLWKVPWWTPGLCGLMRVLQVHEDRRKERRACAWMFTGEALAASYVLVDVLGNRLDFISILVLC
jgi:hypothetical protein